VTPRGLALAALLAALAGSLPAAAATPGDRDAVAFARATALARAGRCGDALAALSELSAPSAAAAHLRGQCQLDARDYPAALASLEEAKRLDPAAPGVELHLAVARFHMGDYAGAREALDAAAPAAPNDPQLHLYRGLLLLQEARSEEAARELAHARSLGSRVEPGASYYEGLAWAGADEREKAGEALDRVIRSAPPGSPWAQEAQRAKADLAGLGRGRGRAWGFARAGLEYDDNVVLRGDDVFPTAGGQHDVRAVWTLYGGRQLVGGRGWAAGVQGTYYGSSHFDLTGFNQHYPVVGLWLDRRLAEATTARVSYDVGYAWIAYDPFLFTQELRPSLYHDFGRAGRSELFASFYKYDYLYSVPTTPPGPVPTDEADARNRDGWGIAAGAEHTLALGVWDTELTGGLSYLRYGARGTEYTYQGVGSWIGSETPLPWDSVLRTQIGYAYLPFRHASTYPETVSPALTYQNADRSDDRWRYQVELEKYLTEELSVSARWSWLDNSSNVAVFDYDREITGVYLTYRLGR
jgi:tetratricopeptide (TPR) repeat protein